MPVPTLARRTFATAAAAWALGASRPAAAAGSRFAFATDVWTGAVLLDADGRSFVLRDGRQPLTLLTLWAGWCPACAAEMPRLTAMASKLSPEVEVVLVSHPQYWAADQAMAQRRRLPFKLATLAPSNPNSIVKQALLDPDGEYAVPKNLAFRKRDSSIVLEHESWMDWSSPSALNQVRSLMS